MSASQQRVEHRARQPAARAGSHAAVVRLAEKIPRNQARRSGRGVANDTRETCGRAVRPTSNGIDSQKTSARSDQSVSSSTARAPQATADETEASTDVHLNSANALARVSARSFSGRLSAQVLQQTVAHVECRSALRARRSDMADPGAAQPPNMPTSHLDTPKSTCRSRAPSYQMCPGHERPVKAAPKPLIMNFPAALAAGRTASRGLVPGRRVCMQNSRLSARKSGFCAPPRHASAFVLNS